MTAHFLARFLVLLPFVAVFYSFVHQPNKKAPDTDTIRSSVLASDRSKREPEAIPQMTNTSSCEFKDTRNWVCRDGLTLTGADSGKLHFYRLGSADNSAYVSHAYLYNHSR